MRMAIRLLAIPLLTITAYADTAKAPTTPPAPPKDPLADRATMLAPIQVDSLTLTPLVAIKAIDPKTEAEVLVLDEAFAAKLVVIREKDSETVNELTLHNKSERPLFVMAGEVIIGGKQDRIIGANSVIPARSSLAVPVFCVEAHRWDNSSKEFTSAKALAHGRLRGKASFGAQQEVWNEVNTTNVSRRTQNTTDTYRTVAQKQSDGSLARSEKVIADALAKVPPAQRGQMIGFVVAINGKVASVDLFTSPALFRKVEPKLVKSYLTESVAIAATKDAKPPTAKAVVDFMSDTSVGNGITLEKEYTRNAYSITNNYNGNASNRQTVILNKSGAASAPKGVKQAAPKPGAPATAADARPPAAAPTPAEPVYETYQANQ